MKHGKLIVRVVSFLCVFSLLICSGTPVLAANPTEVTITINGDR